MERQINAEWKDFNKKCFLIVGTEFGPEEPVNVLNAAGLVKEEAIELTKNAHVKFIAHFKELKKLPLDQLQPHLQVLEQMLSDKLYFETGVEEQELDETVERLGLEADPAYQALCQKYQKDCEGIRLGE